MCDVLHLVLCSSIQAPSPRLYSASAFPFGFSLHSASTTSPLPHSEIQTSEGFTGSTKCSHVFGVHRLHFRCLRIHIGSWFLVCSDTCAQFLRSASKGTVWPPHCQKRPGFDPTSISCSPITCSTVLPGHAVKVHPRVGSYLRSFVRKANKISFYRRSKAGKLASSPASFPLFTFFWSSALNSIIPFEPIQLSLSLRLILIFLGRKPPTQSAFEVRRTNLLHTKTYSLLRVPFTTCYVSSPFDSVA